jgi:metallophosphoesterase (TIGR03767 family)
LRPLGAVLVLALATGVGTSQAGVGEAVRDSTATLGDAIERLGDPGGGGGGLLPRERCPHEAEELGLCKREPHHADPEDDFRAYPGALQARTRGRGERGRRRPSRAGARAAGASGSTTGLTTAEQTLTGDDPADGFQFLDLGPGQSPIVREELAEAKPGRAGRRVSLLYLAQTTDWQLADEESPSRLELLEFTANPPFPNALSGAWRPEEAMVPQMIEMAVRQINEFADASPVMEGDGSRAPMDMALITGDQADNQQRNETAWTATLLEGGVLDPNSGIAPTSCPQGQQPSGQTADPALYAGVQDYDDYVEGNQFYDPDTPVGIWSDWPTYPGLMDRAQVPFSAEGLDVPSYVVFGNHDGLAQGNQKAVAPFEAVAIGCLKPLVPIANLGDLLNSLDPAYLLGLLNTNPDQLMLVPPDPDRQYVDKVQYKQLFGTGAQPDEHGFAYVDPDELTDSNGAASYYSWEPKPGLRMIGLDTLCEGGVAGPSANGNVDDPQFQWLSAELDAAQQRDELIVVFGHHPIRTLNCDVADETPPPCTANDAHSHDLNPGCDLDPRDSQPLHLGDDLVELFHQHPNVVAYIAGHTHINTLNEFDQAGGGQGDFWGLETASMVDWPPQARLIEVMDNCDGTLSIFGTLIDHAAPATAPGDGTDASSLGVGPLASIGRTLSYNDPQLGLGFGDGEPEDRNVELLIEDPREEPSQRCKVGGEVVDGGGPGGPEDEDEEAAVGAGSLPFTGFLLLGLLIAGVALVGGGRLLRRASRD